jgi:hypothetical protein
MQLLLQITVRLVAAAAVVAAVVKETDYKENKWSLYLYYNQKD